MMSKMTALMNKYAVNSFTIMRILRHYVTYNLERCIVFLKIIRYANRL